MIRRALRRIPGRLLLILALLASVATALSCGTNAPPVPTSPTSTATGGFGTTPFGVGAVDFASCLGGSHDPSCFSAARVRPLVSAGVTAPGAPLALAANVSGQSVTLTWS